MRIPPLSTASLGTPGKITKVLLTGLAAAASFQRVQGSPYGSVSSESPAPRAIQGQPICVLMMDAHVTTMQDCNTATLHLAAPTPVKRSPNNPPRCPAPQHTTTVQDVCTRTATVTDAIATRTVTVPGREYVTTVHPTITRTVDSTSTLTVTVTTTVRSEIDRTLTSTFDTSTLVTTGTNTVTETTVVDVTNAMLSTVTVTETDTATNTVTFTPATVTVTATF